MRRETPIRVGWLCDAMFAASGEGSSGASRSDRTLWERRPEGVELVPIGPSGPVPRCDVYVLSNHTQFGPEIVPELQDARVVCAIRDYWVEGSALLRTWLLENADRLIFLSRGHLAHFPWALSGIKNVSIVPPPIDVERFRQAAALAAVRRVARQGALYVGHLGLNKGLGSVMRWAVETQQHVDFYGWGPQVPADSQWYTFHDPLPYQQVPELMASYHTFVHLPLEFEPFGRAVLEAYLAGCHMVTGPNIGALEYLKAADTGDYFPVAEFWSAVLGQPQVPVYVKAEVGLR